MFEPLSPSLQLGEGKHSELSHYQLGFYKADFRYEVIATGEVVVEDVKSTATKTAVYCLKKKLVKALYDIEIVEV
jgi:hypothetical protein